MQNAKTFFTHRIYIKFDITNTNNVTELVLQHYAVISFYIRTMLNTLGALGNMRRQKILCNALGFTMEFKETGIP